MSTYTLISQTIDVLYTICLYGLISFVGIQFITRIPAWWAETDPRKQAEIVVTSAPKQHLEAAVIEAPKALVKIEISEKSQTPPEIEVVEEIQASVAVEVSSKPPAPSLTSSQQYIDVLALKIYKLHKHQVVKVEAVESQGVAIPQCIKRYAYRNVPNAVVRLKDLESAELVNSID